MNNLLMYTTISAISDGVALLLILIFALSGIKKGFVKTFFSVFGSFISLILAILLCSTVANFLQTKYSVISSVSVWLEGILSKIFGEELMSTSLADANAGNLSGSGIALWLISIILKLQGSADIALETSLNSIICPVFSYYIVCALCILGLYILLRIIFYIIGEIVNKLHKFKVVGIVDGLLGAVFGVFRAIIYLDIIILILNVVPISFFQNLVVELQNTVLIKFINSINIFNILSDFIINVNIVDIINKVNI